ncbi:transporter substrate-binding domain-containing protein [Intrasporangium sp.]|uniref:transporter substrate-binding domain-containing protein n=1 Tax=Intrasporangium sp. TaxID=1925024 RepID=UPI0032218D28
MSQFTPRLARSAALVGLAALALAACGSSSSGDNGAAANPTGGPVLVSPGSLTVCTHLSYKPFEFKDDSGNVVGFDMDLANAAAKQLGATDVKIVDIEFASITSGAVFAAKKCDIAMGAITITDKRKQTVNFSLPYFNATQALLTKKDSGVADLASLKGKKVGVQTDTTGQIYAEKNKDANGYEMIIFDDLPTQLAGLQSGRVDAIINDNGPLLNFAQSNAGFQVVKEFDTGEQYGFVGQKNDANADKIMAGFNDALKKMVADGSYKASYKKWFGSEPATMPTFS